MIVLFFSMVGSFALLLDRPSPGQPTNDNLRAGHVYIISREGTEENVLSAPAPAGALV